MYGKSICKYLKSVRRAVADANGIELEIPECTYEGECSGTCPQCEAEVRTLENALSARRRMAQKVAVLGVAAGLSMAGIPVSSAQSVTPDKTVDLDTVTITYNTPEFRADGTISYVGGSRVHCAKARLARPRNFKWEPLFLVDMALWKNIFRRMRSIRQQWRSRELWGRSVWSSWFGPTAVLPKSRRYKVPIRCWMPRPCVWSPRCLRGTPPSLMAEKERSITRFISFFLGNVAKKVGTPYYDVPTMVILKCAVFTQTERRSAPCRGF